MEDKLPAKSDKLPAKSDKLISMLLIEIHNLLIDENEEMHELKNLTRKLTEVEISNQKILGYILEEQKAEADAGEYLKISGTVTTTDFTFINTIDAPGHPVRGYAISNEGPNTVYVAHNVTRGTILPDLADVTTSVSRFQQILSGEELRFIFNRKKVRNISILAIGGDSTIKAWLTW